MEKQKYKPQLHFPEYLENWKELKFREVLTLVTRPINMEDEKEYYLVTVKRRYGGVISRGIFKGNQVLVKSQFQLRENDFLISKRQIVHNACGLVPKELHGSIVSNEYSVCVPKQNLDIKYFQYFCQQPEVSQTFLLSSIGVHIEKMLFKIDDWFNWKFRYPSLQEQTKIATFLTAVDDRLNQLKQKKALLEQYKKGVMQKIFDQELKFKEDEGNVFPDWEKRSLSQLVKIFYGKDQKQVAEENGQFPILGTGGVIGYTNQYLFDKPSVLIGRKGTIDKPVYMDTPFWTVDTLFYTEAFENTLPKWLYYKFQTINWYLYNEASGVPSLSASTIYMIEFDLPCLAEQVKIANFLTAIDEKISLFDKQITKTEQYKKGLLQQMFV